MPGGSHASGRSPRAAGIEKTRYVIPAEGLSIELDVFSGALTGLLVA